MIGQGVSSAVRPSNTESSQKRLHFYRKKHPEDAGRTWFYLSVGGGSEESSGRKGGDVKRVETADWGEGQEIRGASRHGTVGTAVSLLSLV